MTFSKLRHILGLFTDAVTQLEEACARNDTSIPDIDSPFSLSSEAFREDPTAVIAVNTIVTAATHICAILNPPQLSLFDISSGTAKAAALRVCLESNVAEILREAGPQGLHINEIAEQSGQDPSRLGSCIRYMATHHIFREITPDVFSNNRTSCLLDTGKPVQDLFARPDKKHEDTHGLPALISTHLDESSKALANLWEVLSEPTTVQSNEPSQSAFAKFVGHGKTFWEFFDEPEQDFRRRRFNIAMHGVQRLQAPDIMLSIYDWKTVPAGSVIVDVGGGMGTVHLSLAKNFPDLKIIVQDRPHVVEEGIKVWRDTDPDSIQSGRVTLEAHNFFEPQPQRDVSFFFIKQIFHDWPDEYCAKILTQLRRAASPTTKLLSMDTVIQHACHDDSSLAQTIPGGLPDEAPSPLLANWGAINQGYRADLTMLALFNARERTLGDCVRLFEESGWKLIEVHRQRGAQGSFLACLEATPM